MLKSVPQSQWLKLSEKRIFFGHQSVGNNIIAGVNDIVREHAFIQVKLVETRDKDAFRAPLFAHSGIGKNYDPISKVDAFAQLMNKGLGSRVDIAFFKFCFVDIKAGTDVRKVFNYYVEKMDYLKRKYPKTRFVHVTVPLTSVESGPKAWLKRLLGRSDGYADNITRNEYNDMLRKRYSGTNEIFDLARAESFLTDRGHAAFSHAGRIFDCLLREYTDDGGHLNERGRKMIAQQLLIFLAGLSY